MKPPDKPKPPPGKDDALLDPNAFWTPESVPESAETSSGRQDTGTDSEIVVVSSQAAPPSELYLPEKDRIVKPPAPVRPKPRPVPVPALPRPASPVPARKKAPPWIWIGLIGICLIGLGGWLIWRSPEGRDDTPKPDRAPTQETGVPAEDPGASTSEPAADLPEEPAQPGRVQVPGAKPGTLKLTSDPPGAVVFVNDQRSGATPTTIRDIPAGARLNIRIEAQGYRPWTQTLVFDGQDLHREFHAGLMQQDACKGGSGWVYVTSAPPGATVELDEKRLPGKTPMVIDSVCAGEPHRIRVQARGVRTWWHDFNLTAGQVLNLTMDLEK